MIVIRTSNNVRQKKKESVFPARPGRDAAARARVKWEMVPFHQISHAIRSLLTESHAGLHSIGQCLQIDFVVSFVKQTSHQFHLHVCARTCVHMCACACIVPWPNPKSCPSASDRAGEAVAPKCNAVHCLHSVCGLFISCASVDAWHAKCWLCEPPASSESSSLEQAIPWNRWIASRRIHVRLRVLTPSLLGGA